MFQKFVFFSLLALTLNLGACEAVRSGNDFSNKSPQVVVAPDSVSAMLADAADKASSALATLAAVENERAKTVSLAPVSNAPPELKRAVTVNWIGPVETITRTLSDRASYNFRVIGNKPPIPVVISLDIQNRPIIDVLRDIGLQLGLRGNIKVDSGSRVIEIEYPSTSGLTGTK